MMDILLEEIISGLPDLRQSASLITRLVTAMILGAVIGAQREAIGKPAGLRTHMLVAMGGALFVLALSSLGWI
jgi:putative Mg2+ transporter-C (MgtC) family protein